MSSVSRIDLRFQVGNIDWNNGTPVFEFETIYRFEQLEQVERREETWPATIIIIRSTITKRKES